MPTASINNIEIYFERYGEGSPVLNIGGSGGDLRNTRADLSPLNALFEVVHYDQRGGGQTSKPDIAYSMDDPIPGLGRIYDFIVKQARKEPSPELRIGSARQLAARAEHDVSRSLSQIQAKTLVCAGEYDDMAPPKNSIALVDGIPNAELRVFQGGHFFWLQDPEAMPTIIDFLTE